MRQRFGHLPFSPLNPVPAHRLVAHSPPVHRIWCNFTYLTSGKTASRSPPSLVSHPGGSSLAASRHFARAGVSAADVAGQYEADGLTAGEGLAKTPPFPFFSHLNGYLVRTTIQRNSHSRCEPAFQLWRIGICSFALLLAHGVSELWNISRGRPSTAPHHVG